MIDQYDRGVLERERPVAWDGVSRYSDADDSSE